MKSEKRVMLAYWGDTKMPKKAFLKIVYLLAHRTVLKFENLSGVNLGRASSDRRLHLVNTNKLDYCKHNAHLKGKANYTDFLSQSQICFTPLRFTKIPAKNGGQQRLIIYEISLQF